MKRNYLFSSILVILTILSVTPPCFAEAEEEKSQLGFAHHLFDGGHYYQAVTEYERFIYFNPDHPSVPEARLNIAFCYQRGEQYDKAIELFRLVAGEYHDHAVGKEAAFNVGQSFLLNEDYAQALIEFNSFVKDNPDSPLADKAQWSSAWTAIYLEDYASAQEHLLCVRENSNYRAPSRELASALDELPHLPRPNVQRLERLRIAPEPRVLEYVLLPVRTGHDEPRVVYQHLVHEPGLSPHRPIPWRRHPHVHRPRRNCVPSRGEVAHAHRDALELPLRQHRKR